MEEKIKKWERIDGVRFLRKIGIKNKQKVLDFGSRVGHYSIPAAIIVGNNGIVYSLDKEQEALNVLKQKAMILGLNNIKIIKNSGGVRISLKNESIDVVLLYDVLHYLKKDERKRLYKEVHKILKYDALVSVYPKHVLEDFPLDEFRRLTSDDVNKEIQDSGFLFKEKYCDTISHDEGLNEGCVLNFRKII